MRALLLAGVFAIAMPVALSVLADDQIDDATRAAIFALATKGYKAPASATIRNIHKSKARNGLGYCGEVTVEGGDGYTEFHAILAGKDGTGASVLRLADFPATDTSNDAIAVRQMFVNFGCTE